jgi:hypothetical protein
VRELERLILRAGGRCLGGRRHVRYELDGHTLTLKRGSRPCRQHVAATVALVRRIMRQRRQAARGADGQ